MTRRRVPAPRWQTPLPPGVVGSWGPDVEAYARATLGITLDRWQRRALNRALAFDATGRLVHRLYVVSTGRQNGKTLLVRALIGWALTGRYGPAWAMLYGLAHDRRQAAIPYRAVLADLAPVARRVGPIGRGGLALTRYLGIRSAMYGRHREYHTGSREARDAIRGESIDLGIFDEVRTQRDYDTWSALEPTTTARPDPLILAISTAGDDRSVLLRDWFDRGRRIIDGTEAAAGFGMTWYAAPDDLAADDPRAWLAANPSIAEGRLDPDRIANAGHALTPAAFRSERLNLWSEAVDEWLPAGTWARTTGAQPGAHGRRIVLGVEVTPSWRRASVAVAIAGDDTAWSGVAAELDAGRPSADRAPASSVSPAEVIAILDRAYDAWRPGAVVYSGAAAIAPHVASWALTRDVRTVALGGRELRAASELLRAELVGGRLAHADDPLLAIQARQARPSRPIEGGDWYLSVRESTGDVDALRALAWASWAAIAPGEVEVPIQLFL